MIERLEDILGNIETHSWQEWIYIREDTPLTRDTLCIAINPDSALLCDDGFTPKTVKDNSMVEFLSIQDIVSVIENLANQSSEFDVDKQIGALDYYYKNDAFLIVN